MLLAIHVGNIIIWHLPTLSIPTSSISTLSIPTLSTSTKWELTKWILTKWEVTCILKVKKKKEMGHSQGPELTTRGACVHYVRVTKHEG